MTQTKFFKVAQALVVLVVRLAWILVKVVLLAAAAMLRAVTSGPAPSQEHAGSDPDEGLCSDTLMRRNNTGPYYDRRD